MPELDIVALYSIWNCYFLCPKTLNKEKETRKIESNKNKRNPSSDPSYFNG